MKIKVIFALFALAFSSMSNAALVVGGNVGFTLVNGSNDQSWILDTDKGVHSFIDGTVGAFTINVADDLGIGEMIDGYSWGAMGAISEGQTNFGYLVTLKDEMMGSSRPVAQIDTAIQNIGNYFDNNGNATAGPVGPTDAGFYNGTGNFQGDCSAACDPIRQNENVTGLDGPSMMYFYYNKAISQTESEPTLLGTFSLYSDGTFMYTPDGIAPIPVPAAVWMFGSVIAGMVGFARRRQV